MEKTTMIIASLNRNRAEMQLLLRVPNDVLLMIYKMVFDHNYRKVMKQYRYVWLNEPGCNNDIYWWENDDPNTKNIHLCGFVKNWHWVANYRWMYQQRVSYQNYISTFPYVNGFGQRITDAKVPKRYQYSGFTTQSKTDRVQVAIISSWNYYTAKLMDMFE